MYLEEVKSASTNYEFEREFAFTSLTTTNTNEELAINTGTIGTESLKVDVWHSGGWVNLVTIVDANDNVWINTSISSYLDASTEEFRFIGNTESSDTTLNTWDIDAVLIHTWTVEVLDYELQFEHQVQNVDESKNVYNITIFGSSTENIEIQTWNIGGSSWNAALSLQISTTEQWYNQSIDANAIGSSITWRYLGTSESGDTSQSVLSIDYSGIGAYNFSVDIVELTFSLDPLRPDGNYYGVDENPLQISVSAGDDFDIQIKGTDGTGSPVTNNWMWWDTDSNPTGSTQLTTSYIDVYLDELPGERILNVYIFLKVPFATAEQALTMTLTIQIVKA